MTTFDGAAPVGISAHKRADDLSDLAAELDMIEELGVDTIELPTYDMDIVVGGHIRRPQMDALKRATVNRAVRYTVHGPLSINFMDDPWRLPRHREVLDASLEVAAETGAMNYVLHSGLTPQAQNEGMASARARQRDWLAAAGEHAASMGLVLCVETLFAGYDGRFRSLSPRELADDLAIIDHPAVRATIDFSHALLKLDYDGRRSVYREEIAALAPFARHLHLHDSFGRQDDIWMFTEGERLAYGHGDLHLPIGWGDMAWEETLSACTFPKGVVFNIELKARYWYAAQDCVDETRRLTSIASIES